MITRSEEFPELILDAIKKYKVISIIGLSKNVSKTTTLNHIIRLLKDTIKIGVTSIGRDGEPYDTITELPKPKIIVKKNTIFATAEQSVKNSDIDIELVKNTGFNTPLGKINIYRAKESGFIELAGPSMNTQLNELCHVMKDIGCEVIFIDGAFDRRSFASPIISDATILSTGASVSKNMESVVELTSHVCDIFSIKPVKDEEISDISHRLLNTTHIGAINDDLSMIRFEESTALGSSNLIFNQLPTNASYLVIKGAITDNILKEYLNNKLVNKLTIIATDPTKLFFSRKVYYKFMKKGGHLKVLDPITLIAITVNHTSPLGYQFNNNQFMKLLKERIKLPIFNLGPCDNL